MEKLEGKGITSMKGAGEAYIYSPEEIEVEEESELTIEEERKRLEEAMEEAEDQLEEEKKKTEEKAGEHDAEIFDAQIQFLKDPQIKDGIEGFLEDGLTADKAVEKGFQDPIEQLESQEGRMEQRADDLRDVRDRVLRTLSGNQKQGLSDIPEGSIVVAERLTPSDTSDLDGSKVEGIVTAEGSKTAHAAIIARSMRIPAVVGVGDNIEEIDESQSLLVDPGEGSVMIEPDEELLEDMDDQEIEVVAERVATRDGREIGVAGNVAGPEEVENASERGADGIGLYRTEFMFLDREEPPTEEEHYDHYVEALEAFEDERVIIRTLDIGGDKEVPYLDLDRGENPFLGPRGIRLAFKGGEELFRTQMRALLRAAASENGENLAVMFPLVSSVEELEKTLYIIEDLEQDLEDEGMDFDRPELGVMVETPSAVEIAGELAEKVDFLSIGTNDLTQYTMAASRIDSRVSDLQDPLYPSVIRSIDRTVSKGHERDAWVGMCGEMAGNPNLTDLLVGMGLDELSMSSGVIPEVKRSVKDVSDEEAAEKADKILSSSTRRQIESDL